MILLLQLVLYLSNGEQVRKPADIEILYPMVVVSLPDTAIRCQIAATSYSKDTILFLRDIDYQGYLLFHHPKVYLYVYKKPYRMELLFLRNVTLYRTLKRRHLRRHEENR